MSASLAATFGSAPGGRVDLALLEALAVEPSLSQRQLALRVGMPLSKAHFVLRRLIEKGMVKVRSVKSSRHKLGYLYVLTPRGLEAKARLTYRFLERAAGDYRAMRERVERALDPAIRSARVPGNGRVPVVLLGGGPLAEVVTDVLAVRTDATLVSDATVARVAVVIDPDAERPPQAVATVVDFS